MRINHARPLALTLAMLLIILLGLTGCGTGTAKTQSTSSVQSSDSNGVQSPADSAAANPSANKSNLTLKATLYFPAPDASGLVPVERTVTVVDNRTIEALFKELNNPPTGLDNPIPKGTELLSASVKDGVATLNLSKEFKDNFGGGSTGEQMILYSIVDTLTTLPDVKSVQFLLNGEKKVAILGELDTSTPLTRNESLIRK